MAAEKHTPAERHSFARAMGHLHSGALHRHFGVSESEPLTTAQKQEAANSDNAHLSKMGTLALNMEKWHHGKK